MRTRGLFPFNIRDTYLYPTPQLGPMLEIDDIFNATAAYANKFSFYPNYRKKSIVAESEEIDSSQNKKIF